MRVFSTLHVWGEIGPLATSKHYELAEMVKSWNGIASVHGSVCIQRRSLPVSLHAQDRMTSHWSDTENNTMPP